MVRVQPQPHRRVTERSKAWLAAYFDASSPLGVLRRIHALSISSDTLMTVALAGSLFFSISPGEARSKVTLYLLFTMAPFAILAPLISPIIDRGPRVRRIVVILSGVVRLVGVFLMIFELRSLLLFPLALMNLVASKAYLVSKSSLIPELLDSDSRSELGSLVKTNANITLLAAISGAIAGVIGAGILKTPFLGAHYDLILELIPLCLFIYESRSLVKNLPPRTVDRSKPRAAKKRRPSGPAYAQTLTLSLLMSVLRGQVGFFVFLVAFALKTIHSPTWLYGAALVASSLGSALATQLTPLVRRKLGETTIVILGTIAIVAVAFVAATLNIGISGAILIAFVLGVAAGGAKIAFDASVQTSMAKHEYGRLFARYESYFQLSWVVGAFVATLADLTLADGEAFLGATALLALASYVIAISALRHSGQEPDAEDPEWI
ncbi:major facilitator superfamily protein [Ferrimicrobium acidiphilum DSM 19497]|uniref:Major facilitator superfamily protein n=2 Tax=Ferrimicrobium acidiphilum TaxID=121039 RepID=A0A0D8FWU4_9ACTN|nr:major facilitator superfamily protein [Ferrimicrobium acidiphilum DSM 19497]